MTKGTDMGGSDVATIDKIIDLDPFELALTTFFPGASMAALEAERDLFGRDHVDYASATVRIAIQSHIVRIGGTTILVDTCVGEHKDRPQRPDWHRRQGTDFLQRLAAAGCSPDDVDIVFCTHLHADHVGWNTRLESGRWTPTFPNARYLVGETELAFWQDAAAESVGINHGSFQDSVLPVLEAGLVTPVLADELIAPGATIVPLPGHTAGQVGLEMLQSSGPALLLCGDAIHSPIQITHPEWSSFLCHDPAQAEATRRSLIERAATDDLLLLPGHLRVAPAMGVKRLAGRHVPAFCDCRGEPV
jgi:glyoxylase-like metal-dependent hydrolase (beta-lactamase superfamily II)